MILSRQVFALRGRLAATSLRTRLTALVVALLLLSCVILTVVISVALHAYLIDRLDQQLNAAGNRYAVSLEHPDDHDGDNAYSTVLGQSAGTLGARIKNGHVTDAGIVTDESTTGTVSAADRAVLASLGVGRARDVQLPTLGEYRISVSRGRDSDFQVTGLPTRGVRDTITRLTFIETVVFIAALVVTAIVGATCIRLTLRPLDRVAHTAHRVTDLPLGSGDVQLPPQLDNPAPGTEVGRVTDAVNRMIQHVETALAERHATETLLRQFVADAGHELRTPVAVIRSHAEFAQMAGQGHDRDVAEALGRISDETVRMGTLVDDLLLLARLDSGRPLLCVPVDLTRVVLDAVLDARTLSPAHRWNLDLPEAPIFVDGAENQMRQVVANLLTNAIEHTPAGTGVVATLRAEASEATVVVTDDGPGIDATFLPHIFERFARADSARQRTGGESGLGLAIADAITRAHHGTISATSEPGATTFTVRMPLATRPDG